MSNANLLLRREGGIAQITLNRPQKRNALLREQLAEFRDFLTQVQSDRHLRAVQLTAEGPVFCAGMDLAQMQETAAHPLATTRWRHDAELYRDVLRELWLLPVPTVAVVQGPAVAGGFGLVLACDLVLASEAATFFLPEPQRGLTAAIVTPLLVYRLGAAAASYLLLSGRQIDAHQASGWGLCQQVVKSGMLASATNDLLESICSGSPQALAATKRHLRECHGGHVIEQLDAAVELSASSRETNDAREGLQAFLEHRNPLWQQRGTPSA